MQNSIDPHKMILSASTSCKISSSKLFNIGSQIFRQITGVPEGLDPAQFISDLFFFYRESELIGQIKYIDNHYVYNLYRLLKMIQLQ